ncbi:MAG: trigger factor [Verrucomicrobiaceae bacterium]|nr:MAG: trigger factor [Verrucomicrobiaceae bacterium]
MNITVEKLPNCMASLSVRIPSEKQTAARTAIVGNYIRQAALPGFRKGKAPRNVVEKRFKADIDREVNDQIVNESLREAIRQEKLNVLNVADFQPGEEKDGEVSFTVKLVLAPEFSLPDYKGLNITVPKNEVTDEAVSQVLERQREQMATLRTVEEQPAGKNDFVSIDYSGKLQDKPLTEVLPAAEHFIAQNEGFLMKLSDENFVPGFCQQLEGIKTGETREVKVIMPTEGINEAIAGKEVIYTVTAKEVKVADLPELNDEFASRLAEGKTLEELRQIILENSKLQAAQTDLEQKRIAAMTALRDKIEFDLPENVVNSAAQRRVNELVKMNIDRGVPQEMIVENESSILQAAGDQAKVDVKDEFLLLEVVKKENLSVNQQDMLQRISSIAYRARTTPQKVIKSLQKNQGLENLQHSILLAKALDVLVQHANIEYAAPEAPAAESEPVPAAASTEDPAPATGESTAS